MIRPPVISVTWAPPILSHYQSPVVLQTYYAILHLACSSACYRNSSSLQLFNLLGSTTYALIPSSSKLGEQPQLECSQSNFNMHCFNYLPYLQNNWAYSPACWFHRIPSYKYQNPHGSMLIYESKKRQKSCLHMILGNVNSSVNTEKTLSRDHIWMELNGKRVNSEYSVLFECAYKGLLSVILLCSLPIYMC